MHDHGEEAHSLRLDALGNAEVLWYRTLAAREASSYHRSGADLPEPQTRALKKVHPFLRMR